MDKSISKEQLNAIEKFMNEMEIDFEMKKRMEERQRKYGTLTEEEKKRQFTI